MSSKVETTKTIKTERKHPYQVINTDGKKCVVIIMTETQLKNSNYKLVSG